MIPAPMFGLLPISKPLMSTLLASTKIAMLAKLIVPVIRHWPFAAKALTAPGSHCKTKRLEVDEPPRVTSTPVVYAPAPTWQTAPFESSVKLLTHRCMVRQGRACDPSFESLPLGAT